MFCNFERNKNQKNLKGKKRKKIQINDEILFYKEPLLDEKLTVQVEELYQTTNFSKIYMKYSSELFGYPNKTVEDMLKIIYGIYSKEQEEKNGVVAISFIIKD